jgi:8-oxo-dGTP pyrophosphatase MutT (NUDIX family)
MPAERFKTSIGVVLILKRDELVLLQKRINTSWMDGFYGLIGGGLEHGETVTHALAREAYEELGIKINEEDMKLVHVLHLLHEKTYCSINLWLQVERWEGEPKIMEPHKCAKLLWALRASFPENTVPFLKNTLEKVDQGIMYSDHGWK